MKCAVLCNGPSRVLYAPSPDYSLVLGCNIPWADVYATVIIDPQVVEKWSSKRHLIPCMAYFGHRAWKRVASLKEAIFFKERSLGIIQNERKWHSSGHIAAEIAIAQGYKEIDIYGCDGNFSDVTSSYTREHVKKGAPYDLNRNRVLNGWRVRWDAMATKHPDVKFTFVGAHQ